MLDSVLQLLEPLPDDIPGGEIIRDPGIGVLCDTGLTLVENISPPKSEEDRAAILRHALKDLAAQGLVGVHDASVFPENLALYKKYSTPFPPFSKTESHHVIGLQMREN